MHSKHLRDFRRNFLFYVLSISFVIEFSRVWRLEEMIEQVEVGQEKLRLKQYFEISGIGSSVPVVSNMASVHDLAENIPEILPGNNLVFGQVIM